MKVPNVIESSENGFKDYYRKQAGGQLSVFRGSRIQKGSGIGSMFSRFLKTSLPLLKQGAKTVGRELVNTGLNVAKDLVEGDSFTKSAKKNLKKTGSRLLTTLTTSLDRPKKVKKRKLPQKKANKIKQRRLNSDIFS